MSYFRESFEYQPIKLFLNSAAADTAKNRGDLLFNLRRNITLPSGTTGYVSLNELTIPNTVVPMPAVFTATYYRVQLQQHMQISE